ncbi:LOW QUALITY PROTEIN: CSD domain-containing protein [Rhodotorula toruloides]|nr:LOW QUALITY PROTEIN: CSD domain-containing protein [Rhodotorula toruloides]
MACRKMRRAARDEVTSREAKEDEARLWQDPVEDEEEKVRLARSERANRELSLADLPLSDAACDQRLDEHLSSTKSPHAAVWTGRNSTRRDDLRSTSLFVSLSPSLHSQRRLASSDDARAHHDDDPHSLCLVQTSTGFDLPFDAPPSPPSSESATPTRTRRHSLAGSRSPTPPLELSPPVLSSCFLPDNLDAPAAGLTVPASPPSPRPTGLQGFQSVVSPLVYFDSYPDVRDSAPYSPQLWQHDFQPYSPPPSHSPFEAGWQVDLHLAAYPSSQGCFLLSGLGLYEPAPTAYPISSRIPSSYSPDLSCFPSTPPFGFAPPPFQFYPPPLVSTLWLSLARSSSFRRIELPTASPSLPSPPIASTPTPPALSTTGKTALQLLEEGEAFWSTGTCKFFDVEKGFGFIVDDHSQEIKLDVFAHYTGVDQKRGFRCLAPGERVEYVLTKLSNGKLQAFRIKGENGAPLQGLTNPAQAAAFDKAVGKIQDGEGCPQIRAVMKERALTSGPM